MSKHEIETALGQTKRALDTVRKYFGTDSLYSFEDNTEKYWSYEHGSLAFDDEPWDDDKGESAEYGYEINHTPFIKEEFSLMYADNGCGEKFYIILDNAKRLNG